MFNEVQVSDFEYETIFQGIDAKYYVVMFILVKKRERKEKIFVEHSKKFNVQLFIFY